MGNFFTKYCTTLETVSKPDSYIYRRHLTGDEIEISAENSNINIKDVINSNKFQDWINSQPEDIYISHILIQSVDYFGPNIGFIKLKATATKNDEFIPGIVMLRGHSVAVLLLLQINDDSNPSMNGKVFTVIVTQPRIPISKNNSEEIPAGMMDNEKNLKGVAFKEVHEETGININTNNLVYLTCGHTGTGLLDELITIYTTLVHIDMKKYNEINNSIAGNESEGEQTIVQIVKLDYLKTIPDLKTNGSAYAFRDRYFLDYLNIDTFKDEFNKKNNCNITIENLY